jgi:transglutaminase-like putative cysteine protease
MIRKGALAIYRRAATQVSGRSLLAWSLVVAALALIMDQLGQVIPDAAAHQPALTILASAAAALGWWAGSRSRKSLPSLLLGLFIGLGSHILYAGQLTGSLIFYGRAALFYGWTRIIPEGDPAAARPALEFAYNTLALQATRFQSALFGWWRGLELEQPNHDSIALLFIWGSLLWLLALWAGFSERKFNLAFISLIPSGLVLGTVFVIEQRSDFWVMALLAGIAIFLAALTSFRQQEANWDARVIDYSEELRVDISLWALGLTSALVVAASLLPYFTLQGFYSRVASVLWPEPVVLPVPDGSDSTFSWQGALGLAPPPPPPSPFESVRLTGMPRQHLLGMAPELAEELVMTVHVSAPAQPGQAPYYWRALNYDTYEGRGWQTGATEIQHVPAQEPIEGQVSLAGGTVRQEFTLERRSNGLLFSAGQILAVNQSTQIAWRDDDTRLDYFGVMIDSNHYWSDATIPSYQPADLLMASSQLPAWVAERYLELPPEVPQRVLDLAANVTAAAPSGYEKALALESYLRSFPYTLDLPPPPADRDIADYFLFDLQQGYCDYYATSMVVMARAVGLPARLAVGFASGVYDAANDRYIVRQNNAHSWVEIYFVGTGWVIFEPTAGLPALERSDGQAPPEIAGLPLTDPLPGARSAPRGLLWTWLGIGLLLGGLSGAGWVGLSVLRLKRLQPSEAVQAIYLSTARRARKRFGVRARGQTPFDLARIVATRPARWSQMRSSRDQVKPLQRDFEWLTKTYVLSLYGRRPVQGEEQSRAVRIWLKAGLRIWLLK